ncbi:hypothetical protein [Bacteroides sp. 51]|uniref:hypothetical protein n=1 Tax=Bacteroides sp. 51 TaxID=2302938 RepID=UPI0013D68461|nr:hypothetical protein [Bacteroides sp. 51]NDV82968.1 hypothetical protein [Bacteroides sp. 51]
MKKLLIGVVAGAAGIAAGYCIRKAQEEHKFDPIIDRANQLAAQAKKKAKDIADLAQNEAEYLKDRAEHLIGREKSKLTAATNNKVQKK